MSTQLHGRVPNRLHASASLMNRSLPPRYIIIKPTPRSMIRDFLSAAEERRKISLARKNTDTRFVDQYYRAISSGS